MEQNARKLQEGAIIQFKDVLTLVRKKLDIKLDNLSCLRFIDADNLKIITKSNHVIFQGGQRRDSSKNKMNTYIIQVGKQDLIKLEKLGVSEEFKNIINNIKLIGDSEH